MTYIDRESEVDVADPVLHQSYMVYNPNPFCRPLLRFHVGLQLPTAVRHLRDHWRDASVALVLPNNRSLRDPLFHV